MTLKRHIHNRTPINIKIPISKCNKTRDILRHTQREQAIMKQRVTLLQKTEQQKTKTTVIKKKLFLEDRYNTNSKHSFEIRIQWNKNRACTKTTTEMNRATKKNSISESDQVRANLPWKRVWVSQLVLAS